MEDEVYYLLDEVEDEIHYLLDEQVRFLHNVFCYLIYKYLE